jgi:hypothetical protein
MPSPYFWWYRLAAGLSGGGHVSFAAMFAGIGERLMVDLGLAGLVQKFEDEFGKPWTRRLLGLIGFTTSLICVAAAWAILAPASRIVPRIIRQALPDGTALLWLRCACLGCCSRRDLD